MPNPWFLARKKDVLEDLAAFLDDLTNRMRESDGLWLFSPMTHPVARENKSYLTPVLMMEPHFSGGFLVSETTRRPGIVSYLDLAPSILHRFGADIPPGLSGSVITGTGRTESWNELGNELETIENIYRLRSKLVYPLVSYQMLVLLVGLFFVFRRRGDTPRWVRAGLYSVLSIPLVLLLLGEFPELSEQTLTVLFLGGIVSIGTVLSRLRTRTALLAVSAVTALLILLDGWSGAGWMKHSILGYDPTVGARYYGIGNEFMGVLVGASLLFLSTWQEKMRHHAEQKRLSALLVFVPVWFYLAAPFWGTNAGGTITASVAFAVYWLGMENVMRKIGFFRLSAVTAGGFLAALAGLWGFNRLFSLTGGTPTHIGRALEHLSAGRFDPVVDTIIRKMSMNLHLVGVSSWSRLLLSALLVMAAVAVFADSGLFRRRYREHPYLFVGFTANLSGSAAAFFTNDSGIVSAATMIVFAAVPMLLLNYNKASHSS